jgi:PAS domain S-box-containing protein
MPKGSMMMNHLAEKIRVKDITKPQILLMEDESSVALGLQIALREKGFGVDLAVTGKSALNTLSQKAFDLFVADLRLPDMDGMEIVKQVKNENTKTEVIVITGYPSLDTAVEAMKSGAFNYLPKPFSEEEFLSVVQGALKQKDETGQRSIKPAETGGNKIIQKSEVIKMLKETLHPTKHRDETMAAPSNEKASIDTTVHLNENGFFQKCLIDSAIDGVLGCDRKRKVVIFNKGMEILSGYDKDEVIGKLYFDRFFLVGGAEQIEKKLRSEKHGGKNRLSLLETEVLDKAGNRIPVQISAASLFEDNHEIGMTVFFRDLRQIRKMEEQFADQESLVHQHKLISLGRLAAIVAHEINNPLAGVLNYIRLMIKKLGRNDALQYENKEKFQGYLKLVESETDRCSKLVSDLLAFSRKSDMEFSEVDTRELLNKSLILSQHKLDMQNIKVVTDIEDKTPFFLGSFNQMQQCIINLIFNAIDAMADGGVLTLACAGMENEKKLEIQVGDTGSGIPEDILTHIFDPFYTTKSEGAGLGLGLSTVKSIIERHRGSIHVESELNQGTVFRITLPTAKTL